MTRPARPNFISEGPAICPTCWAMVETFRNGQGVKVLFAHPRPATGSKRCPGSHRVERERAANKVGRPR